MWNAAKVLRQSGFGLSHRVQKTLPEFSGNGRNAPE